jgi:hypothetical protein
MKTILASILAVAFLASTPAFAADAPAGSDKGDKGAKKDDKKKDEKKDDKKAGGGW